MSLKIPPGAVRPNADKPVTVTLQACLSGLTFKYPEGCTPLSAVYRVSADAPFEKEVALTFEHFAELETEEQASEMSFFKAKSFPTVMDGREVFIFSPVEGGRFAVGGRHCTLSTQSFSLVGVGAKKGSPIRKFNARMNHYQLCYSANICCINIYNRKALHCAVQFFE